MTVAAGRLFEIFKAVDSPACLGVEGSALESRPG